VVKRNPLNMAIRVEAPHGGGGALKQII